MTVVDLVEEVSTCNYRKQGGEISESEICEFWLITQKLSENIPDFAAKLYPKDTGRNGNIDSPYTLITCLSQIAPVYKVERVDEKMMKERPRTRSGVLVRFPVTNSSEYENAFTAISKFNEPTSLEFIDLNGKRVMQVWFDL